MLREIYPLVDEPVTFLHIENVLPALAMVAVAKPLAAIAIGVKPVFVIPHFLSLTYMFPGFLEGVLSPSQFITPVGDNLDKVPDLSATYIKDSIVRKILKNGNAIGSAAGILAKAWAQESLQSLHYVVIHGDVQQILLGKINKAGELIVFLQATIDKNTSDATMSLIDKQFTDWINHFCDTCTRDLPIRCTIFTVDAECFYTVLSPIIPGLDAITNHLWSVMIFNYSDLDTNFFISNVSESIRTTLDCINFLVNKVLLLTNQFLSCVTDDSALPVFNVDVQTSQLLRYLENIYKKYNLDYISPIERTFIEDIEGL